jgi:nickel transport protein
MQFEEDSMNPRKPFFAAVISLLLLSSPLLLWAHKVYIYAWVEGDRVFTEGFFPDGHRAAHSQIEVFDKHGNKLLAGKTDNQGMYSFKLPEKMDLKIVLRTPTGHRAEFNLKAGEKTDRVDRREVGHSEKHPPITGVPCLSEEEIRTVVEKVLDERLRPVQERLAASQKRGPSITEVLGGIGYIIGLIGVAMYFSHRKKAQTKG